MISVNEFFQHKTICFMRIAVRLHMKSFYFIIGKSTSFMNKYDKYPMSIKTVLHLTDHLLDKSYSLTTDNFYTSPQLSDYLLQCRTDKYRTL